MHTCFKMPLLIQQEKLDGFNQQTISSINIQKTQMGIASILISVPLKIVDTLQSCFLKTKVSNGQINKNIGKKQVH